MDDTSVKSRASSKGIRQNKKHFFKSLLETADIHVNGSRPWDIQINDERFYDRALQHQSLGLGEAYIDGWWDCDDLSGFFYRLLGNNIQDKFYSYIKSSRRYWLIGFHYFLKRLQTRLFNESRRSKAYKIGKEHYDIGNMLFEKMLDSQMNYSCGYWVRADNLEQAQQAKMKLICDKLGLKPGQKLLDIGCGWGGLARFAARHYGAQVVGITVSKEQKKYADQYINDLPIEIRLQDYRDIKESFDHIASVGMFEHVGSHNHRPFIDTLSRCLKPGGLFVLHTIGGNVTAEIGDPWIKKYIFPQGLIPSIRQIGSAIENRFVMEDWHNFGPDYAYTLTAWYQRFQNEWSELKNHYSEGFYRMWRYYLLACAGAFRARTLQLWQIVLSNGDRPYTYHTVR